MFSPGKKLEVSKRLEREGRSAEARKYREERRHHHKRNLGLTRQQAVERSWEDMLQMFPPLDTTSLRIAEIDRLMSSDGVPLEASEIDEAKWIRRHLELPQNVPIKPEEIPSVTALGYLKYGLRDDDNKKQLLTQILPKMEAKQLDLQSDLAQDRRLQDDGRKLIKLYDRILAGRKLAEARGADHRLSLAAGA